jgi:hypothetical protein
MYASSAIARVALKPGLFASAFSASEMLSPLPAHAVA